jgi:E3 ubiquitin-protein ligase SHPRH
LNTALELQAIARVDRIGQQQETNVWLYLVDGTVEESIHQLSVKRRMEHMGKTKFHDKGKSEESTPEVLDSNLEEANSLEMQQAPLTDLLAKGEKGSEVVKEEDLWDCLFGAMVREREDGSSAIDTHGLRLDKEVRRHLVAEAATERLAAEAQTGH